MNSLIDIMMLGFCRRRVVEVCRTKKKCGFRGFLTSCSGSQMNPSRRVSIITMLIVLFKCKATSRALGGWIAERLRSHGLRFRCFLGLTKCSLSIPQRDLRVLFLISFWIDQRDGTRGWDL